MTFPGTIPIETHDTHSERLIRHAEEELAKGDRLQASEKAWGAVAHKLKSIAGRHGWEYETHRHVYRIVRRIAAELNDDRVRLLFSSVAALHRNYYVDAIPLEELAYEIQLAKQLLEILDRAESR